MTGVLAMGGGGGGSSGDGDHGELEMCPNCETFDPVQLQELLDAAEHICEEGRNPVKSALQNNEYGRRESNYSVRGWHHPGYHTGDSQYHYSINKGHPGFTGVMEDFFSIDEQQQLIELAGTLVHEYFHHKYEDETDYTGPTGGIRARTSACVSGYIGD